MKMLKKQWYKLVVAMVFVTTLVACGGMGKKHAAMENATDSLEIYEVHHDGRIHVFYDKKLYREFLALGETPFRLTHIGAGPNGETVVYGLTKQDKKKPESVAALQVYEGKTPAPANFYGELRNHGRIYVFSDLQDMSPVRRFGHPNFFFTEIGAGPKGETVVYVLNKKTKKKRPDALIAQFKQANKVM
jgi:hypothetical protein